LGYKGQGTAAHFGLTQEVDLIMATFSKSLASTGGYVAGSFAVIDYIKHFGRSMIFSASITPANLAAAREALKILIEEPERVQTVMKNAKKLKESLIEIGWQVGPSESPIIPVHVGKDSTAMLLWKDLLDAGVYVNAVLYPAVDRDQARLRVSTMATHTDSQISQTLEAFEMVGKRYGLLRKQVMNATR
jgi:7-keto-8-aminopelargonate synthetase-like enzyme